MTLKNIHIMYKNVQHTYEHVYMCASFSSLFTFFLWLTQGGIAMYWNRFVFQLYYMFCLHYLRLPQYFKTPFL